MTIKHLAKSDGQRRKVIKTHTGGRSSACFSALSGLAFRFAKTPSFEEPVPTTREFAGGIKLGSKVDCLCPDDGRAAVDSDSDDDVWSAVVAAAEGSPLMSRCLSSSSPSLSDSLPSSKASSKALSCVPRMGSSWRRRRDEGDEDRE